MSCVVCQKPKANLVCGVCEQSVCKNCTEFLEGDPFSFFATKADYLTKSAFCSSCFTEKIQPELTRYADLMEKARNILVFEKSQGKETRLIKRKEPTLAVAECPDKEEILLRLAFFAAEKGFNAIIDFDLKSKKVKDGGSRTHTVYSATAIPANVSDNKLIRDRSLWSNPN